MVKAVLDMFPGSTIVRVSKIKNAQTETAKDDGQKA
jgi:hypothetical protein